jgi:hypothetical protein
VERALSNAGCSSAPSRLVQTFARRATAGKQVPPQIAMRDAVRRLRARYRGGGSADDRMRFYLSNRRIISVRVVDDLSTDAALEPIGGLFVHGFNIVLTRRCGRARLRFTLAHEICHTFFYELVPEMKFVPHTVDPMEERLCDFGAAELLMPALAVRQFAAGRPVCMESLSGLAGEFSVSLVAMFLRLRALRLWDCVLSEWHRLLNGSYVLSKFYGAKRHPWQWQDPAVLERAWHSNEPSFGSTVVGYQTNEGDRFYSHARFEVRRLGNRLLSLWGNTIQDPGGTYPLLDPR